MDTLNKYINNYKPAYQLSLHEQIKILNNFYSKREIKHMSLHKKKTAVNMILSDVKQGLTKFNPNQF